MSFITKKLFITSALVSLFLFQIPFSFALSKEEHEQRAQISARYLIPYDDGTETDCLVTGNETLKERREIQKKGCTLETLQNNDDIEVELTLKTTSGFKTVILSSKYYLMWINSGLHAVNLLRNIPFVFTSLVTLHPIDSLKFLSFSVLYNIGLYHNAKNTLYPYLTDQFSSYFFPSESVSHDNIPETEKLEYGTHALIIGADLIMWWTNFFIFGGFNSHELMLAMDFLHLAINMAL